VPEGRAEFLQQQEPCDKQLFSYQAGGVCQGVHVTRNAKTVSLVVIVAGVVIAFVFIARDLLLRRHGVFDCGDGPRRTIDMRDFATEYSAYSVDLEANVADKVKVSTKLKPVQQQQLSEALQSANEFRKYVVAGYDSCAITKVQYNQDGERFQAMDGVARQITGLLAKPSLSQQESSSLAGLIDEYGRLAAQVSTR
jgi:hypothetical protein